MSRRGHVPRQGLRPQGADEADRPADAGPGGGAVGHGRTEPPCSDAEGLSFDRGRSGWGWGRMVLVLLDVWSACCTGSIYGPGGLGVRWSWGYLYGRRAVWFSFMVGLGSG